MYYALGVKLRQDMENNNDLSQALKAVKNVANNASWFRGDPHRWPIASLPLAYAVACVEVVSKMSDKAGIIYKQIIEAWQKPGATALYEAIISEIPSSEIEKAKNALLNPELSCFQTRTNILDNWRKCLLALN